MGKLVNGHSWRASVPCRAWCATRRGAFCLCNLQSTVDPGCAIGPHAVDPVHKIFLWKINPENYQFLQFYKEASVNVVNQLAVHVPLENLQKDLSDSKTNYKQVLNPSKFH
jgi:hypothetical protein